MARRRSATRERKRRLEQHEGAHKERRKGERKRRQETGRIWSAKCRGIFTSRVYRYFNRHRGYIRQKGEWGWVGMDPPVYFRRPEDRESFVRRRRATRRDTSSREMDESCTARRLEIRTHCKAFLMTEEILSYTHPFRTPRLPRERFVSGGGEPKDRESSVGAARALGGRGASLTALTTCHWR